MLLLSCLDMDIPSGSEDECEHSDGESIPETDDEEVPANLWMSSTAGNFDSSKYHFGGDCPPRKCIPEGSDPMEFFKYFMRDQILEYVVKESNDYANQKEPPIDLQLTKGELPIIRAFCVNRWEQIKNNLHFADNLAARSRNDPGYDRIYTMRHFLDAVRERFTSIPMEENLCVDEQMIATKGRTSFLQYMKAKPHKWGYKVFALCGKSGIAHDFYLYVGKEDQPSSSGHPNMGMSSNVVVRLSRSIPRHINHKKFFDNFATSEQLMIYLHKEGIQAIGTVRQNRVKDHGLIGKAFAKTSRATFETRSCTKEGVEMHLVQWNDTRKVTTLSNYMGAEPTTPIQRYNRRTKTHVEVKRPLCIGQYNEGMGGVDLMDSLLG